VYDDLHYGCTLPGFRLSLPFITEGPSMKFSPGARLVLLLGIALIPATTFAQGSEDFNAEKRAVLGSVERHAEDYVRLGDQIWALAETAFEETESSRLLADYAEAQGFRVERGVAEMPTAFVASYGSGRPIIGILGEFDALAGISQKAQPDKEPLHPGAAGHGCGHNLFGVASLGAAISIKELIESGRLQGTVRFYGTPAEERFFGKLWMARAGLFDDLDVCMDWHPGQEVRASVQTSQALVDFIVEFHGQAAHAAFDPWNGRSAGDGLELFTTGLNYLREHVKPTVRIHYHIEHGGGVVNVVPDYARIWTRVRDSKRDGVLAVYERVKRIAAGAAMMAEVEHDLRLVSGVYELLPNRTGGAAIQRNLEALGPIEYTAEETAFAMQIQAATGGEQAGLDGTIKPMEETREHPDGGSTDVGDVSWIAPVVRLSVTTAPGNTPWHSWAVVACGGMSIGHKGMLHAARILGLTMVDLYQDAELRAAVRAEFEERKGDAVYEPMLPPGPPPIPE
jgi:aminobenzoyl-glutamate utilization protein B